jgi:DNA-binding transcriptional LysR family regulator
VAAAARLNKSQPAVTMTVKALEREMGVPLFEREGRGKKLTAAGARLAAKAAGILEGARRLKEDVAGEPEVPRGPVRVGAGEGGSDSRGVPVPGSRGAKPA